MNRSFSQFKATRGGGEGILCYQTDGPIGEELISGILQYRPSNNDFIHGKALKPVSFALNKFYQIEPKPTSYWQKRGEQLRNKYCIYNKS